MSWDVLLIRLPRSMTSVRELPDYFKPEDLGSKAEVLSTLKATCPEVNLSDPTWGVLDAGDFSIEFNMGSDDHVDVMMLHVRGSDSAVDIIEQVCKATGWRALDCSTGEFINFKSRPVDGFGQWRAFRNRVVGDSNSKGISIPMPKPDGSAE